MLFIISIRKACKISEVISSLKIYSGLSVPWLIVISVLLVAPDVVSVSIVPLMV